MINIDAQNHVKGKSIYLDDIPEISGTLYCLPFYAEIAHGRIKDVNIQAAKQLSGISAIFLAEDIPGANQIGGIIPDEPLFAVNEIHYWGQPIGLIVVVSEHICRKARKLIRISFDELPVITCPREAQKLNHLIVPPRKFKIGQIDKAWSECDYIIEGTADINGQ